MTLPDAGVLQRFHRVLVEEIRERRPEYLDEPFTVAEIYQELVPYRTHRDRLGVEMSADYEDALLRLLAGESSLLRLESEAALRALRAEVESPNPDTGLFRSFAAATVRLQAHVGANGGPATGGDGGDRAPGPAGSPGLPERAEESGGPGLEGATPEDDPPVVAPRPTSGREPAVEADARSDASAETPGVRTREREEADACPWCRETLPDRAEMRFCPFCGTSLRTVPCPECGEELERHWRFCLSCGTGVGG